MDGHIAHNNCAGGNILTTLNIQIPITLVRRGSCAIAHVHQGTGRAKNKTVEGIGKYGVVIAVAAAKANIFCGLWRRNVKIMGQMRKIHEPVIGQREMFLGIWMSVFVSE